MTFKIAKVFILAWVSTGEVLHTECSRTITDCVVICQMYEAAVLNPEHRGRANKQATGWECTDTAMSSGRDRSTHI